MQHGRIFLRGHVISPPLPPNYAIPFHIIPIYAIPAPNSLPFKIVLTLKFFCIGLPYLYVVIEAILAYFIMKLYCYIIHELLSVVVIVFVVVVVQP